MTFNWPVAQFSAGVTPWIVDRIPHLGGETAQIHPPVDA
jgi:hypothetical protein